ncbi:MAG: hypothetical protein KAJ24_01385 [Candidatus Aenigmarchaeota archaeon]|nr:hypothetical protein [Candidatus Aenigmarchaeota archaeon]
MNKKSIHILAISFTIVVVLGALYFFSNEDSSTYCNIELKGLDGCHNKIIQISGTNPTSETIEQHPIMTIPSHISEDDSKQQQSYLDTKYGQFVLLSTNEINCPDKMTITGVLDSEIPPCDPHLAKNCGSISIAVKQYECN